MRGDSNANAPEDQMSPDVIILYCGICRLPSGMLLVSFWNIFLCAVVSIHQLYCECQRLWNCFFDDGWIGVFGLFDLVWFCLRLFSFGFDSKQSPGGLGTIQVMLRCHAW